MATITINELPDDLLARVREAAAREGRTVSDEIREALQDRYLGYEARKAAALARVRARHAQLPETTASEVQAWRETGRR